jgi:hypothetical protein
MDSAKWPPRAHGPGCAAVVVRNDIGVAVFAGVDFTREAVRLCDVLRVLAHFVAAVGVGDMPPGHQFIRCGASCFIVLPGGAGEGVGVLVHDVGSCYWVK